jgi:hypothetical protein
MLDVEQLKIIITIAFLLLIIDSAYSIAIKFKLIHRCRVLCDDEDQEPYPESS